MGKNMDEKRRFVRWQLGKQVSIKLQGSGSLIFCFAEDISLKGIRIRSPHPFMSDASLRMTIGLGYELFLNNIEAAVAWGKRVGEENLYGLYFTKIKDSDKEALSQFIRRNGLEKLNQDYYKAPY